MALGYTTPLVIPPFVGAVAFQQILGRSGAVNLLLREHAGARTRPPSISTTHTRHTLTGVRFSR